MFDIQTIRQRLINTVASLSENEINHSFGNDEEWTIAQVLDHLYLVERAVAYQFKQGPSERSDEPIPAKNLDLLSDRSVKTKILNISLEPKRELQSLTSLLEKLEKSRQQLLDSLSPIPAYTYEFVSFTHPLFGPLSINQWLQFISLYEQRHLEQIKEICQRLHRMQIAY